LSSIEILGFVTGAVCVWLAVRESVWTWPLAVANAVVFFVLFWQSQLYGGVGLQVVFFGIALLGWYRWLRGGEQHTGVRISRITWQTAVLAVLFGIPATAGLTAYIGTIDGFAPFQDALTTVLSLVAQYLLTKKILENWYVWIVADVLYIALYIQRGLYLTSVLYVIFLAMCIVGVIEWRRSFSSMQAAEASATA
jgi:nicotinamide mononucleotide transporter